MTLLSEINRSGALRSLDDALAQTLQRLEPATPDAVLAAAALASLAVAHGHAALALARPQQLVDGGLPWPAAEDWAQTLQASPLVAAPAQAELPAAAAPLVLERGLLYLRRYREYERRLALRLRAIAAPPREAEVAALAPLFAALFPADTADPQQAAAAALALRRSLLLVTGGPGTGKTTTITKLLLLRIAEASSAGLPPPRIALAAPTGRAADRMAESLRRAAATLAAQGIDADLLQALPGSAGTLHRLLGVIPDAPEFRHRADNPLPFDIVVVDEASMVDLPLMCKLVEAVADGAQLILLGDPDQLPSVEAGDVLAAILAAAGDGRALQAEDAQALRPLLGEAVATEDSATEAAASNLHGHRVHLLRGWRQSEALQLAPLAEAVRSGDADAALRLLRGGALGNVEFHEDAVDPLQAQPRLLAHFRALASAADPATALALSNRLRLLTALREGPGGARGLNARIEAQLAGHRGGSGPAWYPGRLVVITENSYRHGLFNGDVGVCHADESGALQVWFAGGGDGLRGFHPAQLPAHEAAFAMTVHKAQGSEFDAVWLQLPQQDARVLSRELVYTGITRAKTELHIAGNAAVIAAALARHSQRTSGLGWRLDAVSYRAALG